MLLSHQRRRRTAWGDGVILLSFANMESFWSRVQVELLDRKRWRTRVELANAIFDYLEIFHNRQRRHSSLGMLTPVEFEARSRPTTAA
jgi:putative transposase